MLAEQLDGGQSFRWTESPDGSWVGVFGHTLAALRDSGWPVDSVGGLTDDKRLQALMIAFAFGAFIEIMPGTEALLHVSEMKWERVEKPEDVVKKGDRVTVKLVDRDERGRLRLSMKALLPRPEGMPEETPGERPPRRERSEAPPPAAAETDVPQPE